MEGWKVMAEDISAAVVVVVVVVFVVSDDYTTD